ncbi:hypothetical protein ABT279_39210, partial [Amycolatopsis sp. NPDC000673]
LPLLAVALARPLAATTPARLHRILAFARRGAPPATARQASAARQASGASTVLAGPAAGARAVSA